MESLGKLGLDPLHLVAQVVNFLIIAWIIYRFLLKPLLATMNTRREKPYFLCKGEPCPASPITVSNWSLGATDKKSISEVGRGRPYNAEITNPPKHSSDTRSGNCSSSSRRNLSQNVGT